MNEALLIVDLQNDFLPKGSLAVPNSDQVIPVINELIPLFENVFTTRDSHPKDHVSFASRWNKSIGETVVKDGVEQMLWPNHCIKGEWGYQYSDSLDQEKITEEFYKGTSSDVDCYSIFFDQNRKPASEIDTYLKKRNILKLFIVGLATDYCVLQTVLDALELDYEVVIVKDGCKAINLNPGDEERAYGLMKEKGARLIDSAELLNR